MADKVENFFSLQHCEGSVVHINQYDIIVTGKIQDDVKSDCEVIYIAAAPPDFRASFTGSGLPFHTQRQAFDNTPNKGILKLDGNNGFRLQVRYPNSYYAGLGTVIVPPSVYVIYKNKSGVENTIKIPVSKGIPYRLLTYPMQFTQAREDAMFYSGGWEMPVRTQEQILRDSAYPAVNSMASDFWGGKPPS